MRKILLNLQTFVDAAVMTDNAANMRKAFKGSHSPAEVDNDEDGIDDTDLERRMIEWEEVNEDIPFAILERFSCVAHTLQLVVYDWLKEATDKIKSLIGKYKKVVGSLHMSCKATELQEKEAGRHIPIANSTRWSSTHAMLDVIVKMEEGHPGLV